MEKTKKIDVFNRTPRKIKCITNEMDYLGDGTIFREEKLVVGQFYTLIEASNDIYVIIFVNDRIYNIFVIANQKI